MIRALGREPSSCPRNLPSQHSSPHAAKSAAPRTGTAPPGPAASAPSHTAILPPPPTSQSPCCLTSHRSRVSAPHHLASRRRPTRTPIITVDVVLPRPPLLRPSSPHRCHAGRWIWSTSSTGLASSGSTRTPLTTSPARGEELDGSMPHLIFCPQISGVTYVNVNGTATRSSLSSILSGDVKNIGQLVSSVPLEAHSISSIHDTMWPMLAWRVILGN
ncbi:uncharacterized protein LOC119329958 isoform X2 [Triticum dicoccoides]|uniref:uncharacterized protein LOC119329958 isoform X2 n=1 Tax=Triticum dicoccoides TaxID=85692 RepID=UPI00188FBA19|nr:uncharacterized protein LOC119329958 isoform X2 [Triticum dicoccoides]